MRLLGSRAVFLLVSFFFIPVILAQKLLRLAAAFGDFLACDFDTGAFRFMPCFFAEARPFAFSPPDLLLPALRCHAGDLAIFSQPVDVSIFLVVCKRLTATTLNVATMYPARITASVALKNKLVIV